MADTQTGLSLPFMGSDVTSQVVTGLLLVVLLYVVLTVSESTYKSFSAMWKNRVELFENTIVSGSSTYSVIQNPQNPDAKTIYFSDNQRSGVEFSYSMFIYINSSTFKGDANLYHIFHKGYNRVYPLMGPGIFVRGDSNTLRIFMNSFNTWNNYCDIQNIPMDKWFHLAITCKGNKIYIYINGNIKYQMTLNSAGNNASPPYQNYGNVYAFNSRKLTLNKAQVASLQSDPEFSGIGASSNRVFDGSATGMLSRAYYFGYALTYTEIQYLMNMAPSKTIQGGQNMAISPYLADTWWAKTTGT